MPPLADYLARFDYAAVTLVRAGTGHLTLEAAAINGRAVTLYLDTGAGRTVLDLGCAHRLGLALEESAEGGGGVGSAEMKAYRTRLASLRLGEIAEENLTAHALDLSHVNRALALRGERAMDGVVGADLLDAREAVIDYRQLRLFLKRTVRTRALAA